MAKINLYLVGLELTEKLQECRDIIDRETYWNYEVDINSEEFKKLREIYDAVCKVMDKL